MDASPDTLLVVEDDLPLRTLYARTFERRGYVVLTAAGVFDARNLLRGARPDVVLLDIGLGEDSGADLLPEIPAECITLVITGFRDSALVRRVLLEGASDVLFKPPVIEELVARVEGRLLARSKRRDQASFGDDSCIELDGDRREMWCAREARRVRLSAGERQLLALLLNARGGPVSRDDIARDVHGGEWDPASRRVDALVSRLRRKLQCETCGLQRALTTVHNHGYRLTGSSRRENS